MSTTLNRPLATNPCGGCGAAPGVYHRLGCPVERCPYCGGQLLTCLASGCPEADGRTPWPPPHDDRETWTGDWPGARECRAFGWYSKLDPGRRWVPCPPNDGEASEDMNRLYLEADWDRGRKRFVRTNLSEALATLGRRNFLLSRGVDLNRARAVARLTKLAAEQRERGGEAAGYVFYTLLGKGRLNRGEDFALHFGPLTEPTRAPGDPPARRLGKAVCSCLARHRVRFRRSADPARPLRVVASSVVPLD